MSTKIVEGVEYITKEIPGEGMCLVPKLVTPSITEEDIVAGAEFRGPKSNPIQICLIETYKHTWLLGGRGSKFTLWSDKHDAGGYTTAEVIAHLIKLGAKKV